MTDELRDDLTLKTEITRPDFHCRDCGAETSIAPDPPARAVCEECCDDHDYRYLAGERNHVCMNCGKPATAEFYDES